jgi:chorismate synthase
MTSSIGKMFVVSSFGESHGKCVGIVIDGCPAGLVFTENDIQDEVDRRRPKLESGSTTRTEEDKVEILSGLFSGITTGAPITMIIQNKNTDSSEYEKVRFLPRPGHADFTAFTKYGGYNDYRGGGRFSGRITAGFVMAGAVAKILLKKADVEIIAHTVQIGNIKSGHISIDDIKNNSENNPLHCADIKASSEMIELIQKTKEEGNSVGGIIEALALNVPIGLGEPVFDTLEGDIAKAMFAIPAVKGIEFGSGFSSAEKKGTENNDPFDIYDNRIITTSNNAGGILGGISNGMPIVLRVAIKPTPSISKSQNSIDMQRLTRAKLSIKGRHDACIVPRAVPVVESMVAIVLADFALRAGIITGVIK